MDWIGLDWIGFSKNFFEEPKIGFLFIHIFHKLIRKMKQKYFSFFDDTNQRTCFGQSQWGKILCQESDCVS